MKNIFLDAIFPPKCCGCDKITLNKSPLCGECEKKFLLPYSEHNRCPVCFLSKKDCLCSSRHFYDKLSVPFINEGSVRKNILGIKFRGRLDMIKPFALMLARSLEVRGMLDGIDLITFIPMGQTEKFFRGYNQAQLLAKELSKVTKLPCRPLLKKFFASSSQHKLDSISRSGNLLGAYEPVRKNIPLFRDKTVLIVDDIITTGATLNEAAKTLLIFGARSVQVCACAATRKNKK